MPDVPSHNSEGNYAPRHAQEIESVLDKEPDGPHDIIYWAKAQLEQQVKTKYISIDRYYQLLRQLEK